MKRLLCLVLAGFIVLSAASAQRVNLKIASVAPSRSPWDIEQKKLAQEWSRITNGQVTITFYDANAQGGENGVIRKMRTVRPGQKSPIDGAIFTSLGIYELAPDSNVMTLCVPFLFRDQNELDLILDELSDEMKKPIIDKGYELLGWFNVGWAYFFTKEKATTPAELKSMKLSVGGFTSPELGAAFKACGFTTEDLPNEKLMQSLRSANGIKGLYTIPMYAYAARYYESLPYMLDLPICPVMSAFVVSKAAWDAVPDKYKPELMAAVRQAESKFITVQQESDNEYLQLMEEAGATRVSLTPEQIKVWEDTLGKDAEKMSQVKNSIIDLEFYQKMTAVLEKYRAGIN